MNSKRWIYLKCYIEFEKIFFENKWHFSFEFFP
jgi:hypothetical protein